MEVSVEGFGEREGKAVCSMCFGIILVPIIVIATFWNENDVVLNYSTANLAYKAKVVADCAPAMVNNDKLVLAACDLEGPEIAQRLPQFLQSFVKSFKGAEIAWETEIYVWREYSKTTCTKTRSGKRVCTTTYTCKAEWGPKWVDSRSFSCFGSHSNEGHKVPPNAVGGSYQAAAYSIKAHGSAVAPGQDYSLDSVLQQQMPLMDLTSKATGSVSTGSTYRRDGSSLKSEDLALRSGYLTTARTTPSIGDIRIKVRGRFTPQATVVAQQKKEASRFVFAPWPREKFGYFGKETKPLEKLLPGRQSAGTFVSQWNGEISHEAWMWRVGCFLAMLIAFEMIFAPLSVLADLLMMLDYCTCCLGSMLNEAAQCAIHVLAISLGIGVYLLTVSVAWIVARPELGIALLAGCAVMLCLAWTCVRNSKKAGGSSRQLSFAESPMPPFATEMAPVQATLGGGGVPLVPQVMQVACPAGVSPGDPIVVVSPSGQQLRVAVPGGVAPGQVFQVQLAA